MRRFLLVLLFLLPGFASAQILTLHEFSVQNETQTIFLGAQSGVEHMRTLQIAGKSAATIVIANATFDTPGELLISGTIDLRGVFDQSSPNGLFVTWIVRNGSTLMCQSGDGGAGGTPLTPTSKTSLAGNCTNPTTGFIPTGTNLTLEVIGYNSRNQPLTIHHYWGGTSNSSLRLQAVDLGTLSVALGNASARTQEEGSSFTEACTATCSGGSCIDVSLSLETYDATWASPTGNITLNQSQQATVSVGNVSTNASTTFWLEAASLSPPIALRCSATSTYSSAVSSNKTIIVVDTTPPSLALVAPLPGAATSQDVSFTYEVSDAHLSSCALWGNWSGAWQEEQQSSGANFSAHLPFGDALWGIVCSDSSGNSAGANRTLIVSGNVILSGIIVPASPAEGDGVSVVTHVRNAANRSESVLVRLSRNGAIVQSSQVVLGPLGSNTTTYPWVASIGDKAWSAIVDPSNTLLEYDEIDNTATNSSHVSMWQAYYGNVSQNATLGSARNDTLIEWIVSAGGNVYIADTDTTNQIDFIALRPLGNTTSGAPAMDDFVQLDSALNSSDLSDSINASFTNAGDLRATHAFTLFGTTRVVPAIDSSASGAFQTGVLWDSSDSSDAGYDLLDREDIVFLSHVQPATASTYGVVDYEILVPARLRAYKGEASTLTFYYEVR